MSNLGLERALAEIGLELVRTQVGDRYVVEEMRRSGYNLGGEQSGHVIFLDHNTTGDGLLTALQVLAILRRKERPLSELVRGIERFPQVLLNVAVAEKRPLEELPELAPPHPAGRGGARRPRARADPLLGHRAARRASWWRARTRRACASSPTISPTTLRRALGGRPDDAAPRAWGSTASRRCARPRAGLSLAAAAALATRRRRATGCGSASPKSCCR